MESIAQSPGPRQCLARPKGKIHPVLRQTGLLATSLAFVEVQGGSTFIPESVIIVQRAVVMSTFHQIVVGDDLSLGRNGLVVA